MAGSQPRAVQRVEHHGGVHDSPRVPAAPVDRPRRRAPRRETHRARAHALVAVELAGQVGHEVLERHRPVRVRDGHDGPVHEARSSRRSPPTLATVADSATRPASLRRIDDDLLPHRPAALVAHVVAFVEHHRLQPRQPAGVEHVAEDLGGHHQDGRARVDLDVAGEDADLIGAELAAEVGELLVGQRLERRGVGEAPPMGERAVDGELRHQGLARPGGRGDDHRLPVEDGLDRAELEIVQRERVARDEGFEQVLLGDRRPLGAPRFHGII